jgi:hypothetical protein
VIEGHSKFLQVVDAKPKLINKIEIGNKTFYPNDTVDSQNPLPYIFESTNELDTYLQNARNETYDTLYLKVKSIYKKYVDAEEKYIVLLAADTILSYFQDKFATMHYNVLVGDNGSGKNSALLVYRYLGYRVFYVTAASAANYYTFLGETEEGQGTLAEDEADNIHLQQDKYKICKTGYASGGSVPKVDIHSGGGNGRRSQGVFLTYCMKWFAMEELPDYKKAKGFLDRSFVYKFIVGRVKYNIKDVINYAGDPKFKPLHDELLEVRKLLFAHRILHFNDVIYGVNLNIRNRNEELTKPLIRLFRNSPAALAEILPVLSEFLNERNEVKRNSFESKLFEVVKNLIRGGEEEKGQQQDDADDIQQLQPLPITVEQNDEVCQEGEGQHQPDAYMFTNEELWVESKKVMGGTDILGKSQSFYTVEFGAVSHKKITETFMSKFKAKSHQTGGDDNRRCLIFSKDVLDRIAIYYDLPDKIQILPDEAVEDHDKEGEQKKENRSSNDSDDGDGGRGGSQNSARNTGCEVKSEEQQLQLQQVIHVTDITDSRNKQALGKENLSVESVLEEEQEQTQQQVTHVTDITHPNDTIESKEDISLPLHTNNDKNNSDMIVELPNSYNNSLDQIAAVMSSTKTGNTPVLSPTSVITATCVTKKENDYIFKSKAVTVNNNNNNNKNDPSLADLPSLSCLFCDNYKTKIRFDMELHLSEKHRHSLVYNLPIGKANMDDRIEYALQLIETGTNTTIPYQIPNSSDEEEEEGEGEEDEDEYQY